MELKTREVMTGGAPRVMVSDGQGTSATYPLRIAGSSAPGSGDALHGKLAEALRVDDYPPFWQRGREGIADLLLPVVERFAAEQVAAALNSAAELLWGPDGWMAGRVCEVHDTLRARADTANRHRAHVAAVRLYLAEQKGWMDAVVEVAHPRSDVIGYVVRADRPAPAKRKKPVAAVIRLARYLEGRRVYPQLDPEHIHGVWADKEDEARVLAVSDLQALIDYIREA